MAKVGFSAQNTHLRPSSICPPYFWFCRSCIQLYSSSSSRVYCRLEDKVTPSAKGLVSSGAVNVDVLELKQQSSYSTFHQNDSKMQCGQRSKFPYPSSYREPKPKEEDWVGELHLGRTAEEWDRATQDCKKLKRLYATTNHVPVDIRVFPEKDIAEKADSGKRKIDEGKEGGLSLGGLATSHKGHIERAAINTPVQGSAADVAMCAMLEISKNARLQELVWKLILQVHDEVILEGPTESAGL